MAKLLGGMAKLLGGMAKLLGGMAILLGPLQHEPRDEAVSDSLLLAPLGPWPLVWYGRRGVRAVGDGGRNHLRESNRSVRRARVMRVVPCDATSCGVVLVREPLLP